MNFQPLTELIEGHFRSEKGIPSCDIKIMQEHKEVYRYKTGHADHARKVALEGNETYNLYSCTKPITCTAALRLVEDGVIGFDDPVYKYLPEYKNAFIEKDGEKIIVGDKMTVKHLITMSAGLDYCVYSEDVCKLKSENPNADTISVANEFIKRPLSFAPGERFSYSLCHDVLGAVISAASGMKLYDFMKKSIFDPLGMTRTSFSLTEEGKNTFCARYDYLDGVYNEVGEENYFEITKNYESGGAGLRSTVHDYSLFADALANGGVGTTGNRILSSSTVELMRTPHIEGNEMLGLFDDGYQYGLGVRTLVTNDKGARSSIGEFGWDGAAGSYVLIDPKLKLSAFLAIHVNGWQYIIGRHAYRLFRDTLYDCL